MSTLHQILRCQSPDGLYTIDIRGDRAKDHLCFTLEFEGKVKKLTEEQIKRLEKRKAKEGEEIPKDIIE